MYDKFKDYDFADAKPVAKIPALAQLQVESGGKTRITMYVDDDVLAAFRTQAEEQGIGYQTAINQVLRDYLHQGESMLEQLLRKVIREEMQIRGGS
ncbi:MAG: BrnA antitoxin family protein [Candidatus Thiothrix putei]|uniref:BrnA antitoxin family protein n=1 Tax=Candidatus Thiothrix putei TaxID=3080811 RepID=A0AA95HEK0_9GAMM|nr:MAG: BrnA antitoxin family protein [Candidatus Thiothrix putei]